MSDDITDTLAPNSTQLDAVDLLGGSRIFTVERVVVSSGAEQPVTIHLAEFDRPWKPGKNMRRVLGFCWSVKSSAWVGRRVELFCDPTVSFGGKSVGGTRISRLSHIDGTQRVPQIETRGKSAVYIVEPLPDAPAGPTPTELAEQLVAALADCTTEAEVREWGNRAHARNLLEVEVDGETVRNHVEHRLAALQAGASNEGGGS